MNYREDADYQEQIGQLRRIIVRTPMWCTTFHDGQPVVVATQTNELLLRIVGAWTPDLQRFFEAFNQYNLLRLLALLEAIPGNGRQREAACDLLAALLKTQVPRNVWSGPTIGSGGG